MIRRPSAVLATVIIVATTLVAAVPTWAHAQTSSPTFSLADQSPWVAPNGIFSMKFQTANVPTGAQVVLTAHDPLQSRTAFDASVSGGSLPPSRELTRFPFDSLPVDAATGQRLLAYPTSGIRESGVYPLEVDLRDANDESLAHFVTHVVVEPVNGAGALTVGVPLQVAWVWPLRADPAYVAGPAPINPSTQADLEPTGRLGRQATQLAANTDVPLTLVPSPETVDAWSALGAKNPQIADGSAALRTAGLRNQVLAGPFVPLDLPAMFRSKLDGLVNAEIGRGATTLETFWGAQLDSSTALPGHLDQQSLQLLQNANTRRIVIDGTQLTSVDEKYTPAHPYKMQSAAGDDASAVTVVATDPGLEEFLRGDDPPALRAAHVLSGLALVAGEQPSITRGVAITNPDRWDANDTFVAEVLAGLRNNPQLHATTIAGLIDAVPAATVNGQSDGAPVYRQLVPYDAPAAPVQLGEYQNAQAKRNAVAELVGNSDPRTVRADRALASSVSADWINPPGRVQAHALLASIGGLLDGFLGQIKVQSQGTITITSSKAQIPISFQNTSDKQLTVHVKLESDRLLFPGGSELDVALVPGRSTTVRVAVETRGSGTAPVQMTVTTTNGLAIPDGTTTIKVRSTFVSGVGVFLTVGAIVFLALWWGWDINRRRKRRSQSHHPSSFPVATPSGQPA